MSTEVIGFAAGSLIALSLVPQVIKSIKTRSTIDISLQWSLISVGGQILWLVYGITIGSTSLYVMSGVTLTMTLIMLWLKLRYGMGQH
jgi:MtN3 and saliva related transmembrane protein